MNGVYRQSPLRVAGRAIYVIEAERLALTSLPVMSPEVVRCVWDEHRRLRHRRAPPFAATRRATSGISWATPETSKNTDNFTEVTPDLEGSPLRRPNHIVWNRHRQTEKSDTVIGRGTVVSLITDHLEYCQ